MKSLPRSDFLPRRATRGKAEILVSCQTLWMGLGFAIHLARMAHPSGLLFGGVGVGHSDPNTDLCWERCSSPGHFRIRLGGLAEGRTAKVALGRQISIFLTPIRLSEG